MVLVYAKLSHLEKMPQDCFGSMSFILHLAIASYALVLTESKNKANEKNWDFIHSE